MTQYFKIMELLVHTAAKYATKKGWATYPFTYRWECNEERDPSFRRKPESRFFILIKTALDPGFRRGDDVETPVLAERTTGMLACPPRISECLLGYLTCGVSSLPY